MSLRLFIDEDTQNKKLVLLLLEAGHDVLTVNEAGLAGQDDSRVLFHAMSEQRILLTQNCNDFRELHLAHPAHAGIIAVYKNPGQAKDLTRTQLLRAIANLESSGWDLTGQFVALNQWNY